MPIAIMTAAPRPCTARAAISSQSVGAMPAQDRGHGEQEEAGQQQPAAADDVAQPPDADDQGGDGEQIGEHDPLDLLERGVERCASVGKATLAMLVPSEDSRIASDRLASAQRSEGVLAGVFVRGLASMRTPFSGFQETKPLRHMAVDARFALYSCI